MRVALVAEGRGDLAVLVNILKGKLGLDLEDVQFLRPEYFMDETDLHDQKESGAGGWVRVKNECVDRSKISEFLTNAIDDDAFVVVQIDTAEAHLKGFDVVRPERSADDYVEVLHSRVVERIAAWLAGKHVDRIRFAAAVEETDAWVLTLHTAKDTAKHHDAKRELDKVLGKTFPEKEQKRLSQLKTYRRYDELTRGFRKPRDLERCAKQNASLRLFLESLAVVK